METRFELKLIAEELATKAGTKANLDPKFELEYIVPKVNEAILIDLASKPGGIDFEEANKLNLENYWALALPGKVAPKTAAKYIYESIKKCM